MSSLEEFAESEEHPLLTMREATKILRIGRSLGDQLAHFGEGFLALGFVVHAVIAGGALCVIFCGSFGNHVVL